MAYSNKEASPRGQGIELTATDSIATDLAKTGYAASRAKREERIREHEQSLISQLVQLEQEMLRIKELSSLSTTAKSRCHSAGGRSLKNFFPWSQVSQDFAGGFHSKRIEPGVGSIPSSSLALPLILVSDFATFIEDRESGATLSHAPTKTKPPRATAE